MARILLQTTIPFTEDDWHVGRFRLLAEHLARAGDHEVVARDRAPGPRGDDPVLLGLTPAEFDQVWVFGVDGGGTAGLSPAEIAALQRFHDAGGGLMLTRDHHDMGCALSKLRDVGAAHCFQTVAPEDDPARHVADDDHPGIEWPNYHSGRNGAFQAFERLAASHPLLRGVRLLPAHPHEGALRLVAGGVGVARGRSKRSQRSFLLVVAFDRAGARGRAVAHSSFHHFADYNLDLSEGAPTFVTDPEAPPEERDGRGPDETRRYWENLAGWLTPAV